jgi:hypothetical protein
MKNEEENNYVTTPYYLLPTTYYFFFPDSLINDMMNFVGIGIELDYGFS